MKALLVQNKLWKLSENSICFSENISMKKSLLQKRIIREWYGGREFVTAGNEFATDSTDHVIFLGL